MVDANNLKQRNTHKSKNISYTTDTHPQHMLTVASGVPITAQLPVHTDLEKYIDQPYVARACAAVSIEHPHGSEMRKNKTQKSVLQQHCDFFDTNNDGVLTPVETYTGFRRIGFNWLSAFIAAFCIHFSTSYGTGSSSWPDPYFRIELKNIHRGKHGSDSGVYDEQYV